MYRGRRTVTVVPRPTSLWMSTLPSSAVTTYLGTWSYESGVLTLTRPSAEETYVFFAQDADTLLMHSGDLVMTQPGAVLTRLAQ